MIAIEQIKTDKGSWEKTARALYLLLDEISDKHPETGALIAKSFHTESAPKNKPGRKSPDFQGSINGDDVSVGLAEFALLIRNADQIKNNQKAAEYILKRQIDYGMREPVTPQNAKRITRSLAKRISDADPERKRGHGKYSK